MPGGPEGPEGEAVVSNERPTRQMKSRSSLSLQAEEELLQELISEEEREGGGGGGTPAASPRSHYHRGTKGQIYSVAFRRHKAD